MNVTQLAGRARLDARAVRYVLDHGIVPGVEKDTESRGAPRVLDGEEALAVSVSAWLLKAGLKRKFVQGFVRGLFRRYPDGPSATAAWLRRTPVGGPEEIETLEIADRAFVRLGSSGAGGVGEWRDLRTGRAAADDFLPLVVVRIDLAELRRRLHEE